MLRGLFPDGLMRIVLDYAGSQPPPDAVLARMATSQLSAAAGDPLRCLTVEHRPARREPGHTNIYTISLYSDGTCYLKVRPSVPRAAVPGLLTRCRLSSCAVRVPCALAPCVRAQHFHSYPGQNDNRYSTETRAGRFVATLSADGRAAVVQSTGAVVNYYYAGGFGDALLQQLMDGPQGQRLQQGLLTGGGRRGGAQQFAFTLPLVVDAGEEAAAAAADPWNDRARTVVLLADQQVPFVCCAAGSAWRLSSGLAVVASSCRLAVCQRRTWS